MESQPQNPEFRNNPEKFHPSITEPCITFQLLKLKYTLHTCCCKSQFTDHERQTDRWPDRQTEEETNSLGHRQTNLRQTYSLT